MHVAGICPEVYGKIAKKFRGCTRAPDTDLNTGSPKYDSGGYIYTAAFGIIVIPLWKLVHLYV